MVILLHPSSEPQRWLEAFSVLLPGMSIQQWPDIEDPDTIRYAVVDEHPAQDLHRYPNLRAILAFSAGVEQFRSPDYPDVPVVRLTDDTMSNEMAAYVLHWIVYFQKRFDAYRDQQTRADWRELPYTPAHQYRVGILGFGMTGRRIGEVLAAVDYQINAWSRSGGDDEGVIHFAGVESLDAFLASSDAIVNLLPDTADTKGLMNADRFAHFRPDAIYITIGRGTTTDQEALVAALDDGRLHAAVLDVTAPEPLPDGSPLWNHPNAHITPHVAGYTHVTSASQVIAANIRRLESGQEPFPILDRRRGY